MTLSTDLGSVQPEPTPSNARRDQIDVLGPLANAAESLVATVKESRLETLEGDFDALAEDAVDQAGRPVTTVTEGPLGGDPGTGDPQADALLANIRTLQLGINQGTGSTRARLQIELRKRGEELATRFPSMRASVAAELSRFEASDPEFAALALHDARNAAFSKQSALDLQEIRDIAYGSVASGGFGMIPGINKFGSPEFAKEYAYKSRIIAERNKNQVVLENIQGVEDLDARSSASHFQDYVMGQSNIVNGMVESALQRSDLVAIALKDPTATGASETLAAWNNGGRDVAIQEIQSGVFAIEEEFAKIPVNQAHTDAYAAAKALKEQSVSALNVLIEGISTDNPSLIQAYEAYETQQLINFERENRDFTRQNRIMKEVVPILELIDDDFGARGDIIRNDIAGYLEQGLPAVLGRAFGHTSHAQLPSNASPEQIQAHYRAIRQQNPNRYGNGQIGPDGIQTMASTDAALRSQPVFLDLATDGHITPAVATVDMGKRASEFDEFLLAGDIPMDGAKAMLETWQSPGIVDMANIARGSDQPSTTVLAADKAEELSGKYEPARRAHYNDLKTEEVWRGLPAFEVINVDFGNINEGEITFRVDEETLRAAIAGTVSTVQASTAEALGERPTATGPLPSQVAIAVQDARRIAVELTRQVSTDLRWKAHIEAVQNSLQEPNYAAQWDAGRFNRDFGNIEAPLVAQ